jgi:hypothetical protein
MVHSYHPGKKRSKKSNEFRGFRVDTKKPQTTLRLFDGEGLASGRRSDQAPVIDRGSGLATSGFWKKPWLVLPCGGEFRMKNIPRPGPTQERIETG